MVSNLFFDMISLTPESKFGADGLTFTGVILVACFSFDIFLCEIIRGTMLEGTAGDPLMPTAAGS